MFPSHCSGGRYQNLDGVCVCRKQLPFWNGQQCVGCFIPNYFDFSSQSCKKCSSGYYHNGYGCVPANCPTSYTFDTYHLRCVCPWYTPKQLNGACVPCDQGTVYNNYTKQCQPCPAGTTVSNDFTICLCASPYQRFSWVANTCECPFNTPILNANG